MITAIVQALINAGATPAMILAAVKAAETESIRVAAEETIRREEKRLSEGRERTRRYRERHAMSRDVTSIDVTNVTNPSPKEIPPTPPKEITPSPEPIGSVSYSARDGVHSADRERAAEMAGDFYEFWSGWPHKVGKPAALKAFLLARRTFSLDAIIAGRERYIAAKPPDRQWLNPATFLNQERFADEPAANPVPAKERPHDALFRALAEIAEGGTGLGGGEVGSDGSPTTTGMADSLHRGVDERASRPPLVVVRSQGYGGRDREIALGVPESNAVGFASGFARSSVFRGSG